MNQQMEKLAHALRLRGRGLGRPAVAPSALRENNYRDAEGRYQLSNGLKPWHTRIVDFMIANPNATIKRVAEEFEVTPQWIGTLIKSDAFKEYYEARMRDHQSLVSVTMVNRMQGLAIKAMEKIDEKLDTKDIPLPELREVAKLSLASLGYGNNGVKVQVNNQTNQMVVSASPEEVARARALLAQHREANTTETEAEGKENYYYVTAALTLKEEAKDAVIEYHPENSSDPSEGV